jgi:hypothetical protein
MGGLGSGRSHRNGRPGRKDVVEDCLALDANRLTRLGILRAGLWQSGVLTWTDGDTGDVLGAISYAVDTTGPGDPWVRLSYTFDPSDAAVEDQVGLCTTQPHLGGLRWWFVCPGPPGGAPCGRRVDKLYLAPDEPHFACRHCHALTYTSCRESRQFDTAFRHVAKKSALPFRQVKRGLGPRGGWDFFP